MSAQDTAVKVMARAAAVHFVLPPDFKAMGIYEIVDHAEDVMTDALQGLIDAGYRIVGPEED